MNARAWLGAALVNIAFGAALLWPAFYNGQPIFFGDTSAYIRGADAGVQALFHRRSAWSLTGGDAIVQRATPPARVLHTAPIAGTVGTVYIPRGSSLADKSVVSGRSPYYGALLYLGDLAGGFWLSIALQALAVVLAIRLVLRAVGTRSSPLMIVGGVLLAGATTAPFFVSFLEPDVFAGVAVLLCAALLGAGDRLSRADRLLVLSLLSLCVLVHESHALIVAVLWVIGLMTSIRRGTRDRASLAILGVAVLVAAAGQLTFSALVKHVVGAAPLRPPFLMARMIEDGPGYRYLRATCPRDGLTVCEYLDRLPIEANLFLWDASPRGVFSAVAPSVRRALAAEQTRFVIAVLAYAPRAELQDALRDFGAQLTMIGLEEFQYPAVLKRSFEEKIPAVHLRRMKESAAYRGSMPIGPFSRLTGITFALAVVVVLCALLWPPARRSLPPRLMAATAWMIAAVLVNSAVCGILSGPHNRYAARVSWVVPLAAFLIVVAASERRRRPVQAAAEPA